MRVFIVDTNVVSFIFKHNTHGEFYKQYVNDDSVCAICFQTLAELEQWAAIYKWGDKKRDELRAFIENGFIVVDSDVALCRIWAEVRAVTRKLGRSIDNADAWIAATALLYGAELVTHNASHFDFLPGLRIITETT